MSLFNKRKRSNDKAQKNNLRTPAQQLNYELNQKIQELNEQLAYERTINQQLTKHLEQAEKSLARKTIEFENEIKALKEHNKAIQKRILTSEEQMESNAKEVQNAYSKVLKTIQDVKVETKEEFKEHEQDIMNSFNLKLSKLYEELEQKRVKKMEEITASIAKDEQKMKEFEEIKNSAHIIESKNKHLEMENKRLKNELQDRDNEFHKLMEKYYKMKRRVESPNLAEQSQSFASTFRQMFTKTPQTVPQRLESRYSLNENNSTERYEAIIARLKKLLEIERKNLRAARTAYTKEVESKTSLERTLRNCIEDIRTEITKKRGQRRGDSEEERKLLMEQLINSEEIIGLIYDKAFPTNTENSYN